MEKKRILKLRTEKKAKRLDCPNNFNSLIEKIKEFAPLTDQNKIYQLIEEKSKKEIKNEEDFQKMSEENQNETLIKISVNIIDKNVIPISIKNPIIINKPEINLVSTEASINILGNKRKEKKIEEKQKEKEVKEKKEKNEIESTMKSILKEKMKKLEDKLVEELYNNLQNEISKSKINNKKNIVKVEKNNDNGMSKMIHKGIICNKCGETNIAGIRFKCAQCSNFNLCENCAKNYIHDMRHIMVKIRYPYANENELISKINRNISYKNQNMNYNLEPKIINIDGNLDSVVQIIKITNTGLAPWRGVTLKCIYDKSEIYGEDFDINYNVNSGSSVNAQIKFNNIQNQIKFNKKIYYSFFQMFKQDESYGNESFGNVTKIKIQII